uniref:Uncharacterized protein n=1 Tax=Gopherus evgoodei TaxID=1825980 RepID=A0A8C4VM65_9SAUR
MYIFKSATKTDPPVPEPKSENYINSKEWLQKNGLKAQKLTLYEALADCTFRHADGVVDIKAKPEDESLQTDAVSTAKIPSNAMSFLASICFSAFQTYNETL